MKKPLLALIFPFLIGCGTAQTEKDMPKTNNHLPRIERIEQGLYPVFNIRGREKPSSIPEMMKENPHPCLSIAFVNSGKVAWTRRYGYATYRIQLRFPEIHSSGLYR